MEFNLQLNKDGNGDESGLFDKKLKRANEFVWFINLSDKSNEWQLLATSGELPKFCGYTKKYIYDNFEAMNCRGTIFFNTFEKAKMYFDFISLRLKEMGHTVIEEIE